MRYKEMLLQARKEEMGMIEDLAKCYGDAMSAANPDSAELELNIRQIMSKLEMSQQLSDDLVTEMRYNRVIGGIK